MPDPKPLPIRQRILSFLTPTTADFLIAESVDITRTAIPEYGTAHPDTTNRPDHKFCYAMAADEQGLIDTFIYAKARSAQDAYNWEFTKCSISGQKFDAVKRTYVTLRSAFVTATPAMGAALANTPASMFASYGSYVLAERQQVRSGDKELDTIFVVDEQTYVKKVPFTEIGYDETFGGVLTTTQTLYYSTEVVSGSTGSLTAAALFADPTNAYWGLQSTGFEREGTQLSAEWYAITNRQVIPTVMLTGRTYTTTKDYYWPGVLSSIRTDSWPLNAGGTEEYVTPIYSKEAYRGPCKASVTEIWSAAVPTITDPSVMMPLPIDLASPFFSINVGPTLHGSASITLTSGTDHPKYDYAGTLLSIAATTPTTWPAFIADPPEVTPYRGGYLKRTVTIYPPSY